MRSTFLFQAVHEVEKITLNLEYFEQVWAICIDWRKHPPHTDMGHSIDWWEGELLVVDTAC